MKRIRELTPLGVEIKKALIEKNMTQEELAERVGVRKEYLSYILGGWRSGRKYVDKIREVLELDKPA